MKRSQHIIKKYISGPAAVSSFLGMMFAVPFAFALSSPANNTASAQSGQTSTAQVSTADFAKFAYAFNQGYEARLTSASASSTDKTTCSEASVTAGGSGSAADVSSPKVTKAGSGAGHQDKGHQDKLASMVNSYNTYTSMVYNSSSVANTNSNNTVGSNNSTSTSVKVDHSKGVVIGVSNDPEATLVATNDSFNKDSYNSSTQTSIVNDSYNTETNTVVDSGNTTNVTKNSNNTSSSEVNTTTNTTQNTTTIVDSYNETTVDTDIDITSQQGPAKPPHHNA